MSAETQAKSGDGQQQHAEESGTEVSGWSWEGYSKEPTPLASYSALLAGFWLLAGSLWAVVRISGRRLPERVATGDILLLGVATHKVARLFTKDWVTSPIRAPFVRYERSLSGGEVQETARGTGMRKALGDLFT